MVSSSRLRDRTDIRPSFVGPQCSGGKDASHVEEDRVVVERLAYQFIEQMFGSERSTRMFNSGGNDVLFTRQILQAFGLVTTQIQHNLRLIGDPDLSDCDILRRSIHALEVISVALTRKRRFVSNSPARPEVPQCSSWRRCNPDR
jgi:hypothetical protein